METPKEYYYTYYSYEEWGRGYIGSRKCYCLPEEDVKYLGSSKDKTFRPTQKIILKDNYATREEAYADEIFLQQYYKVVENSHFANRSYQTSTKFYVPKEQAIENGKKIALKNKQNNTGIFSLTAEQLSEHNKKNGINAKKNKIGIFSQSAEQRSENGKKGGLKNKEHRLGICGRSLEKMSEDGKRGGLMIKELGLGVFALTPEEKTERSRKAGLKNKENKVGIFALTREELVENAKKGGSISSKIINAQRWECCETGYVSTAAGVVKYQKARGIDTSKSNRRRIS